MIDILRILRPWENHLLTLFSKTNSLSSWPGDDQFEPMVSLLWHTVDMIFIVLACVCTISYPSSLDGQFLVFQVLLRIFLHICPGIPMYVSLEYRPIKGTREILTLIMFTASIVIDGCKPAFTLQCHTLHF